MQKNKGFTLIELMITIAVLAIIATMAAPSFGDLIARQKLNTSTRELMMAVSQAKSQAALMKTTVALCLNRTNSDSDFTKGECATAAIPEYTTTTGTPPVQVLTNDQKEEVVKTRVISVQIDPQVVVESTSATTILFNDVGSANSSEIFSFCKSGAQRTVSVTRLGIMSQTSGTC
jgi:prepilin-type N-terminal cleavage/methylation domain-containing protein